LAGPEDLDAAPNAFGAGLKPPGFLEKAPPPKPPPIFLGVPLAGAVLTAAFCGVPAGY